MMLIGNEPFLTPVSLFRTYSQRKTIEGQAKTPPRSVSDQCPPAPWAWVGMGKYFFFFVS